MSTTTTTLPPPVQQRFNEKLLSTPQARLIHTMFADKYEMDDRTGDIMRMRRYSRINTAPVPLGPAMNNPPAQQLTAVDLDSKIDWYGTYVVITKQVTTVNQDPVLNSAAARLGQSMRETDDELAREMLAGSAGSVNSVHGTNADNPTEITSADVEDVVATLQLADGDFMTNMLNASEQIGTAPVGDAYVALGHAQMISQLRNMNDFIEKYQYGSKDFLSPSEWGAVANTRFFLSSRGSITTNASLLGANVYNVFILAKEAYGIIEQNSISAKFIYHPPGHGDDPIELRQTCGWRMAQVPRITNDSWIINLRCTLL